MNIYNKTKKTSLAHINEIQMTCNEHLYITLFQQLNLMVASKYAKKYINKYNTTTKRESKRREQKQELRLMFGYQPT